jgi:trimethylguanosine synthase
MKFARESEFVLANDIDPVKIENAKNNAAIYGVDYKIVFSCQDFLNYDFYKQALTDEQIDVVFLAPPWGGTSYNKNHRFDIFSQIQPCIRQMLKKAFELSERVVLLMPKNIVLEDFVTLFYQVFSEIKVREIFLNEK